MIKPQEDVYRIDYWSPDVNKMSGCGFSIKLYKGFKDRAEKSGIDQDKINNLIKNSYKTWMEGHGMTPDEFGVKVNWGEWGPRNISVPGNACGLDISFSMCRDGEAMLMPHNVDSLKQASLLLTVFCQIERSIYYLQREVFVKHGVEI